MSVSVLVIDDSREFLELADRLLRQGLEGVAVTLIDPGAIGLSDTGFGLGDHDVVLLDYDLGEDGDGIEWLRRVRCLGAFPPTVVITASADPYVAARAIKAGAADYLAKPDVSAARLAQVVREACASATEGTQAEDAATDSTRTSSLTGSSSGTLQPLLERTVRIAQGQTIAEPARESVPASIRGYTVEFKLGEGATAQVYLARREHDQQMAVLKIVTPELLQENEYLERFLLEAELVIDIDSPNVVEIYEQAFTDDGGFIAMEYLPGGDLREALTGSMSTERALDCFRQIVRGLDSIHELGIVHRDLKPANVMLRGDGTLALVDFGISKRAGASELTQLGSILGTPYYMSPEQARGREIDERSDLYSAGVILFEMLTGQKPFQGMGPAEVLYQHAFGDRPQLPESLTRYQAFLERVLAVERDQRPDSARQMLEEFEKL